MTAKRLLSRPTFLCPSDAGALSKSVAGERRKADPSTALGMTKWGLTGEKSGLEPMITAHDYSQVAGRALQEGFMRKANISVS